MIRLVVPDSHGAMADAAAVAAMLGDVPRLDPTQVVLLGDHMDTSGVWSSYVPRTADEKAYRYHRDVAATNALLDELQARAPRAEVWYLEGNHEARVRTWAVERMPLDDVDAFCADVAPEAKLRLRDRGIHYVRRDQTYQGIAAKNTIRLGRCYFTHGISSTTHAAAAHLATFADNVVYGHTHRADYAARVRVDGETIIATSPGCLAQRLPSYQHTKPDGWVHGYAFQEVAKSGRFQHVNVAITRGRSMLGEMLDDLVG